jgi:hypothetical protein
MELEDQELPLGLEVLQQEPAQQEEFLLREGLVPLSELVQFLDLPQATAQVQALEAQVRALAGVLAQLQVEVQQLAQSVEPLPQAQEVQVQVIPLR